MGDVIYCRSCCQNKTTCKVCGREIESAEQVCSVAMKRAAKPWNECVYQGAVVGNTDDGLQTVLCEHPEVEHDLCCPASKGEVVVTEEVRAAGCGGCSMRAMSVELPKRPLDGIDKPESDTLQRWKKIHYMGRTAPDGVTGVVVVDVDPHGFGDAIVAAWIANGTTSPQVLLKATGEKRRMLEMLGVPCVSMKSRNQTILNGSVMERATRGYPPRWQVWGRSWGFEPTIKRPTVMLDDEVRQWARDTVSSLPRPLVCLCPQTHHGSRQWPEPYWAELHAMFESAIVLGLPQPAYKDWEGAMLGKSWEQNAALMLESDLVIGNDSGPIHLSGTLDVPSIAILGPTGDAVFSHMPSVRCIAVERRRVECVGCWLSAPYDPSLCNFTCAALANVSPQEVHDLARKVLSETQERALSAS